MTVSFVGANAAAATSVTIPAHQVGDLILIYAYRDGSNTSPTTPTAGGTVPAWTNITSVGSNTNSVNFRYAVATSTTTTSGTWTNATEILCMVYRGASIGANIGTGGASATISYPALTLQRQDNSSWVVGIAGHRSATNVEVAPTGMTNRISTGTEIAGHDSNGTRTSWSAQSVTVNANSGWRSSLVELRDKTVVLTSNVGSAAITGNNANLVKAAPKTLVANSGAFSISGSNANLYHGAVVAAALGAVTLTGNATGIQVSRLIVGSAGSYNVTVFDISLHIVSGYDFNPDQGQFTTEGNAAQLRVARIIAATTTSYTVAGFDATFTKPLILVASTRGFNINGIAASLVYGGGIASEQALLYQSVLVDPRKMIISTGINEDQLVYYIKGFFRIL